MKNKIPKFHKGLTLVELSITLVIVSIIILGLASVMADAPRGFNQLYNKVNSEVQSEADIAKIMFESTVRKASEGSYSYDTANGNWLEVSYYSDVSSGVLDRYARFYVSGNSLILEQGDISPRLETGQTTISENVSGCEFKCSAGSAKMSLSLDDGTYQVKVSIAAVMHNP